MNSYRHLFSLVLLFAVGCASSKMSKVSQFSDQQSQMILSGTAEDPMRVFKITDRSDSLLLRTPSVSVEVDTSDAVFMHFVDRLYATVTDSMSLGVGIAAPQVGILKDIIWVQRLDKEDLPFEVYFNPEITFYSEQKQDCREGCLSIPNRRDTTKTRAYRIEVEYDKIDQKHYKESVEGFTAVIFQHEIDHLDGILYLDHLEQEVKDAE
ncbi:peptide deformylase [Reichenbachiella ulvae]|uniref:Peptide deformylase n=1 Tax=Reichenbachiella ulvae TaxID=2980104 RepID=A0ABT3CW70_9BACT|nr:peptide deformylase [Reichenbachiella ulvae]MCV9387784.1 peptide deformylase [Reichenbachiella ulvae]